MYSHNSTTEQITDLSIDDLARFSPEELSYLADQVIQELSLAKAKQKKLNSAILERYHSSEISVRQAQGKMAGTVSINDAGFSAKITRAKKVEYDQQGLAILKQTLDANDQGHLIKVSYSVPETVLKDQSTAVQAMFEQIRTVKTGTPTVKLERVQS